MAPDVLSFAVSSARRTSPVSRNRRLGSVSRQRRNSDCTDNDVEDGSAAQPGSLPIAETIVSEVEHVHRAVGPDLPDLDVCRFQTAMDDAPVVRAFQRVGDLLQSAAPRRSEWPRAQCAARSSPSTSSMTSAVKSGVFLEAVDRPDVRIVEGREHFCFALKARKAIRVAGQPGASHVDRRRPFQMAVGRRDRPFPCRRR